MMLLIIFICSLLALKLEENTFKPWKVRPINVAISGLMGTIATALLFIIIMALVGPSMDSREQIPKYDKLNSNFDVTITISEDATETKLYKITNKYRTKRWIFVDIPNYDYEVVIPVNEERL